MRALEGLTEGSSGANAIGEAGQIVGWHEVAGSIRAFLWSESAGARDLGLLPGYEYSSARAVNAADWAVGSANTFTPTADARATLFVGDRPIDLNGLIPSDSGWLLLEASDINDAGQIVGVGLPPSDPARGVLRRGRRRALR